MFWNYQLNRGKRSNNNDDNNNNNNSRIHPSIFFPYYDMQFTLEKNLKSPGTLKVCVHLGKNKNEEVKEINTLTKVNF